MKRMKRLSVTTVGLVGLFTAAALAWFALGVIEGTGVTHAGKGSPTNIPVKVVVAEGVTPTQEEPIEHIAIESSDPQTIELTSMHFSITTGSEATCPASNFSIVGVSGFEVGKLVKGETYTPHYMNKYKFNLKMASAAPEACEGVEVKVHVVVN
jgi:hypothetical protein